MALPTVHAIPLWMMQDGSLEWEQPWANIHLLVATVQAPWKVCRRNACASVRLQVNACQLRQGKT